MLSDEVAEEKPAAKPKAKRKAAPKAEKAAAPKEEKKAEPKKEKSAASEGRVDEKLGMVYDSAPSEVDDLKEIGGVGPKLEEKLKLNRGLQVRPKSRTGRKRISKNSTNFSLLKDA